MRHDFPSSGTPVWIDLHNPTDAEIAEARQFCGLRVPARAELDEIESSSRLRVEGETLVLSVPLTPYHPDSEPVTAPIGFVLTPALLVTVRFDELHTFHKVGERLTAAGGSPCSSEIFMEIVEAIVDNGADKLETIKSETRTLSRSVFHARPHRNISKKSASLRETLVKLGDMDERLSETRETLLTLQRALPFVEDRGKAFIGKDVAARLKVAQADIVSLNDFETHLTDKVQFLLDATLGFISNEQNDMFRVLTIASVVGIPPVFVAGVYGMNFHNQPEFNWAWGYEWGWLAIIVSTILPIAWFKWRGWW
ncbi:MAG: magnesium transporter CorA family protein [Proteobacteria bacterium]|nr:magnesium transporter CorA family protein [Pseudomonadota bacterium]